MFVLNMHSLQTFRRPGTEMVIVLKRAILRFLQKRGYVLLKKDEYDAAAIPSHSEAAISSHSQAEVSSTLEAERAFYFKRVIELEEHNRQLTEAATKHASRAQELDRELLAVRTEIATKDYPRLEAERAFYSKRVVELEEHGGQLTESYSKRIVELEEHNRQLTESATKHALRLQKLERAIGGWVPEFKDDDGTIEYAKASGAYAGEAEAPVAEGRLVAPIIANPPGTTVILTFGQSNAANSGEEQYAAREAVHVFNMFDMRFYRAIDPLPGASENRGSVWGRLGDKLIDAGFARSVLFVPIAFGATYIEDWAPGGQCYPRLMLALHRLKKVGIAVDLLCWHQGEANANHTPMTADEYRDCFRAMLRGVREAGVKAPVYVALATLCEDDSHPFQNSVQIRLGQKELVSLWDMVMPGPDTDQIGTAHRWDGCHFSASGQELAAQAWFLAITAGPLHRLLLWSKYRLESMFARSRMMTVLSMFTGANMMTVLKRANLRTLERRGYVLLKTAEYESAANADGLGKISSRKYVLAQADGARGGGRMTTVLKRLILRSLDRRGYVLLRKAEYDRMAATAGSNFAAAGHAPASESIAARAAAPSMPCEIAPPLAPAAAIPMPAESTPTPIATPPAPSDRPSLPQVPPSPVPEFAADSNLHAEFERACGRLRDKLTLPLNQALAIYCAVRHLIRARIPGDVVDCGEGRPEVLALVAASLAALGETSRRLVLFDVTSDFRHRPETDVPLWGADYDLMSVRRPPPRPKERVLPDVLAASGYPAERIVVVRYPVDTIDLTRPIAFLGLNAETYEANRAAVRTLAPRVSIGGVIAVEGNEHTPRAAIPGCVQHHLDAVAEFLKARGSAVPFWQVTDEYRLAVKSRPFAEQD
jgi:hypothetical protein